MKKPSKPPPSALTLRRDVVRVLTADRLPLAAGGTGPRNPFPPNPC